MSKADEAFTELMKEAEAGDAKRVQALAVSLFRDWPQEHRVETVSHVWHRMKDMDWELQDIAQGRDVRRDRDSIEALERKRSALVDGVLGAMRAEGLAPGTQHSSEDRP
jgi:hypothetical protein